MTDEDLVTRLTSQIEGLKEVIGQEVEVYALRFLIDKTKTRLSILIRKILS